jgi:succinate dehydrogenase / fumarate reductase cytochrome b subunit
LWPVKLGLLAMIWAYCHHFCAGVRFLLLDLHRGIDLATARATSWLVLAASLAATAFFGWKLW